MLCPFCQNSDSKVLDSRPDAESRGIRRRRECLGCSKRFRTIERTEDQMPLVLKRNGTHEPFNREKLLISMRVACGKRPVTTAQIDQCEADLEWQLLGLGVDTVSTIEIGARVMESLKSLDDIAYVRYASVYRRFRDVEELLQEMRSIAGNRTPEV